MISQAYGRRRIVFLKFSTLGLVLALAPALASAQAPVTPTSTSETVATAQPGSGAPPTATASKEPLATDDPDDAAAAPPHADRRIHGVVGAGVGANGYREVFGAATVPIGTTGQVSIAIDSEQAHRR